MEELAKSVQQAQAAVLGVQDDLALLRTQLERDGVEASVDDSGAAANPYTVELQTGVQQKQEVAAQLLQHSAHLFYEQFGALEEKAVRLQNVREKEKELQAAKTSMRRYFDAHATELADMKDTHDGVMRLERERRHHLEEGAADQRLNQHQQQLAHHVILVWMKKAMIRNLTREYATRQRATRQAYQAAACEAIARQREVVSQQRVFYTWRSRLHSRQLRRLEEAAVETEKRAQFFRQELATTQQVLHDRLGAALEPRPSINREESAKKTATTAGAGSASTTAAEHEDEVRRLRTALEEMTVEFSERTGTYIRQQEHLEQLFWSKEQKLRETAVGLQANLHEEQRAFHTHVAQQRAFSEQVNAYWEGQHREWQATMQRKEEFVHYSLLGLVGRLRHRHRALQDEAAKLASEVRTLAPLSERCVQLENQLAAAQQLLQKAKDERRVRERRASADGLVSDLLTDRAVRADNEALRMRYFAQWMQCRSTHELQRSKTETYELKLSLQKQRQQLLLQQQTSSSRHQAEVAQLRDNLEQLRRTNVRLQLELDAAARAQQDRDRACYDGEVKNGELSAALLRERMERRGLHDKWWCSRVENVALAESHARCGIETQECQWWSALQRRERTVLTVWTASLRYDAAQLTAVCEGWEAHCHRLETEHDQGRRTLASQLACALERALLQSQTLTAWTAWRAWTREQRTVRTLEAHDSEARKELVERHGNELARLHARHDTALRRQQQELTMEKTQLQAIHQERSETQRRVHAQEQFQLGEQHRRQLAELQAAHADVTAELNDEMRQLHGQVGQLGSVVVEYCAAATFARWRAWAMQRRTQRDGRLQRGFLMRAQEWHVTTARTQDDALLEKVKLLADFTARAAQDHHASSYALTQRLSQELELHAACLHKLELAKDAAATEAAHLRGELQHTRSLYDTERQYGEAVQQSAAEERRDQRAALSLASRLSEWREASHRTWYEQQRAVVRVFEDAVTAMLDDTRVDAQALQQTYVDCVKECEATRTSLNSAVTEKSQLEEVHERLVQRHEALQKLHADASREVSQLTETLATVVKERDAVRGELDSMRAEKSAADDARATLARKHDAIREVCERAKVEAPELQSAVSAYVKEHERSLTDAAVHASQPTPSSAALLADSSFTDDPLEVSALDAEEEQQHRQREQTHESRRAVAVVAAEHSNSTTASGAELYRQILPGELARRLCELETYSTRNAELLDREAQEHLCHLLHEPFVFDTSFSSASSAWKGGVASISQGTAHPPDVIPIVCHSLETLRNAALRWAEAQVQRRTADVASLNTKRAQSEAALTRLRENMEGLLEEQRSLAGEMQSDVQSQTALTEGPISPSEASLMHSQTWRERLGALTSRYARVLDTFRTDIARRQDTFYSVNGMLVEVDQFSEGLLQRFEENMQEMARLKHQLDPTSVAAQRPCVTPVSHPISHSDLSMMSPEPQNPQRAETPFLARVLGDTVTPPPSSDQRAEQPKSPSASTTPPMTDASPERHAVRERVHLLEKLLVEAKVQIAEASAVMDSARRAASIAPPPSLQAQVWAAQDAKDFAQLALTEADFLSLYTAAESTAHAVMTALRSCTDRLKETQGEMSQQLQTACVSVEESVRQRYRAEAERYEATLRSSNDSLAMATKQHAKEKLHYEQLLAQQRAEAAKAAEKHTRDTQLMRQNYTSEMAELTEHLQLLEEELERTRQAANSAVQDAVARQTELLDIEHAQALRGAEKNLTRLTAEKVLLEERWTAKEEDYERRLQLERRAVARLQRRLDGAGAADANVEESTYSGIGDGITGPSNVNGRWETYVSCSASLFVAQCDDKAEWFTACVAELVEQAREEWETEVMHLRERLASLLEKAPSTSPFIQKWSDKDEPAALSKREDTVEDTSSQALTLSPSPQRTPTTTRIAKGAMNTHTPVSPRRSTSRCSPARAASAAVRVQRGNASVGNETRPCASTGTSPTRRRSPSVDSLELTQSLLRYSKMLSDHRTRNTERLERATALTAEVDDLLLCGVELGRLADTQGHR
ncbi:hypothetical protein ABB37_09202 [Leptomonas pyrrhocoris]|uniref:Uncharacterized protein n=1 Tax=Leptomonas pyrrhocoris TaxID=157538 RepID=A0A0N0DRF1_LEPPY|nr:hypothetical protein ABB37_09202 [Leptomonas pyrrhocoris]XP_015653002.1 hypothetical protein ABB37_09202 [Leptomonas pyrrhocoris]KPA74562.1 hypothetical protein ABB37_09202 [Leptomonas pyrrhocoris]KPA74563.1 hypothetical protein ABB37_09202 [Leptomonas pyrrhocoris]|eukprot:XP_015653001.1 hypothetical protein ABB37_09202 [Leptomonas pyrrhocoris]